MIIYNIREHRPKTSRIAVLIGFLVWSTCTMAIEEPDYETLEKDGQFELRDYASYLVAETRIESGFSEAGSAGFRRLFDYISGNNESRQKISMTAPVTQSSGQKIAMTAPVTQSGDATGYLVAFVVPSSFTIDTVPTPVDPKIEIREVPARLIACWRYSGRWTEDNYRSGLQQLRAEIESRGLVERGEPILARYNPPFTPWFMRRNEVLIPVGRK